MPVMSDSSSGHWEAYPEMKDSGVEWLGEIPIGWKAKRLKQLLTSPLQYGANEAAELDDPELPRFVRITDIKEDGTLRNDTFKSLPEDVAKIYLLKEGNLLFARSGATVGKTFLYQVSWGKAAFAGYLIRALFNENVVKPEFIAYFCKSRNYWNWLSSSFIQSTIQNVSAEKYANLIITIPSLPEQKAIASFLDERTSRIDAIIEKKERQIELLNEKRSALIFHAVTKGLDPDAEMKDSGVEWLGKIPVGWDVLKLGWLAHFIVPMRDKPTEFNGEIPWIRIEDFNGKYISDSTSDQRVSPELVDKMNLKVYPIGTVLCSCSCNMGVTAIATRPLTSNQTFIGIVPSKNLDSDYLYYLMNASSLRLQHLGSGAIQQYLSREQFSGLKFGFPPLPEQKSIADFLDRETARIDGLVEKVEASVGMLREYRAALISAAVTGKIDVRGEIRA